MPASYTRHSYFVVILLVCCCCSLTLAVPIQTTKLKVMLSANEQAASVKESGWDYSWAGNGQWTMPLQHVTSEFTINSSYTRDADKVKTNSLKTATRLIDNGTTQWHPVFVVQTDGDHSIERLNTSVAFGYRRQFKYGFIEGTTGMRKDLQTADAWTGDTGIEFGFDTTFDRIHLHAGPKATYATLGSVRVGDDRLRYDFDTALEYRFNDRIGIGYKYWVGNTTPDTDHTQWFGLTYTVK